MKEMMGKQHMIGCENMEMDSAMKKMGKLKSPSSSSEVKASKKSMGGGGKKAMMGMGM